MQTLAVGLAVLAAVALAILLLRGTGGGSPDDPDRLARLLVAEIKLYNQDLLEEARREKAILVKLGEDLGRSRQMYLERVGEQDPSGRRFDDAVLTLLADGDPSVLGS